eukprot:TRINITY_DN266_c0_g1_i1.p1 TRINITY_DN266_c0_g1~~TRINITY_DN266_c0_g1_i1.p1  ORF type:complete len:166 (-),score=41.92 TRINITY_DN266_c0_g1_i1:34-531(-)
MGGKGEAVVFGEVNEKNLGQLKLLNTAIFPVKYYDKFYKDLLLSEEMTRLAYYNDVLVGAVCCRLEPRSEVAGSKAKLYIMTLGVLSPYRRLGIGKKMLEYVLGLCEKRPEVDEIYLHVQTSNEDAINFYKKFSFEIVDTIKNYYKKIDPPDCYVLRREIPTPSK